MRKNIHQYFMDIAKKVAERSTCIKRQVGSVIVKNKKIISCGYNGAPTGLENCNESNCLLDTFGKCRRGTHSELSAIMQASPDERQGATMYITLQPCEKCSLAILNSGITQVIYDQEHPPEKNFFIGSHVQCQNLKNVLRKDETND